MQRSTFITASFLAAVVVLSSTVGVGAATLITGASIKDGSLTGADIRDGSLTARDVAKKSISVDAMGVGAARPRLWHVEGQNVPLNGALTPLAPAVKVPIGSRGLLVATVVAVGGGAPGLVICQGDWTGPSGVFVNGGTFAFGRALVPAQTDVTISIVGVGVAKKGANYFTVHCFAPDSSPTMSFLNANLVEVQ
jgi:hypothetical protein